jgi:hypothetical protein
VTHRAYEASQTYLRLLATGLFVVSLISCSGGGGGTPTGPSNPSVSIQGTWVGTATSVSASGTCLADGFHPLTVPAKWVIQQNGDNFTGQQTLNNVATCPFRGTVNGAQVTFYPEAGGSAFCTVQTIFCPSAPQRMLRMELRTDRAIQAGTVAGNRLAASGSSVWHITDARTGQAIGDYEVRGTQDLQKQ